MELFIDTFFTYGTSILPWILFGIICSYFAERYLSPVFIKKYFSHVTLKEAFGTQLLGMISPLSILSFLPLASEFVYLGFNAAILFSFLIAERAYDLQSFFIITTLFGLKYAIFNAFAIFISLCVTVFALRNEKIVFIHDRKHHNHFWERQIKLLLMVTGGIFLGALLRTTIPQDFFTEIAGSPIQGFWIALFLGFVLYFGPIVGNYPVAKAFADLGMSKMGVFAFLTISPVFNVVVIMIFTAAVGYRATWKAAITYALTGAILSSIFNGLLY